MVKLKEILNYKLRQHHCQSLASTTPQGDFTDSLRFDIAVYTLLGLLGIITYFAWPRPILGAWESLTFFHNYGPLDSRLSFAISVRANIGGQGYALLDISRQIADVLGWSLSTVRLPALIIGWLGLCIFYAVTRRIVGNISAFCTSVLLATNAYFSFFQNTLLVSIVTFTLCLFVIERMQAFENDRRNFRLFFLLALAVALSGLHYGMGKLLVLALLIFLFAKIFIADWRASGLKKSMIRTLRLFAVFGVLVTLIFSLLNWKNAYYFLRLDTFFMPSRSDIQYPGSALYETLITNITIFIESLTGGNTTHITPYVSEMLFDRIYTLTPTYILPLIAIGLGIAIVRFRSIGPGLQTPYLLVLVLIAVTVGMPMFSLLSSPSSSTLSQYRLFHILIPTYILLAIGIRGIVDFFGLHSKHVSYALMASALFVSAYEGKNILDERQQFALSVDAATAPYIFTQSDKNVAESLLGTASLDAFKRSSRPHAPVQLRYRLMAKMITNSYLSLIEKGSMEKTLIYFVDLAPLSEKDLTLKGLFYVGKRNFHAPFIALYAADMGIHLSYVQPTDSESTLRLGGMGYRGKPRTFSANLAWVNGRVEYETDKELVFHIRKTGPGTPNAYLATTEREIDWLKSFLSSQGKEVEIIPVTSSVR